MTDKAIEAAAKVMCRSGKFETGQGTCALMCMSQLGDPRKRGCQDALTVFGDLMRAAIAAYEQALWQPIEEAPKGERIDLWVETIVTAKSHMAKNGKRIVRDCQRSSSDPIEFVDSSGRSVNHVCFYNFEGEECLICGNDAVLPEHNKGEIIRHRALLWRPRPLPPPPGKEIIDGSPS